jgi:hypothetical protein
MSKLRKHSRTLVVAVCCVAVGAAASAIAVAGASTGSANHTGAKSAAARLAHGGRLHRLAARAVQGSAVLYTKQGFKTATFERGAVDSVSGQQLQITEGTPKANYKTVTVTIPSTAHVRDNRQTASLSSLQSGQRVVVVQAPSGTFVIAHTARAGAAR